MTTLPKKIGRYEFDILAVVASVQLPDGNYEFSLPHGVKLTLTPQEKQEFDQAMNFHKEVLYVYGACRGMGLRG